MFWGLIMEPGKKYSQTVEKSFHVSQAALDLDSAQNEPVQVLLGFENRNYLLCTLQKGKWVQVPLDLNFQIGDKVSFATNGPGHVHLTGYLVPEDDMDLLEEEEDEEEDEEVPELETALSKKRKASDDNKKEQDKANKKTKTEMLLDAINDESDDSDDSDVNLTDMLEGEEDAEEAEDEEDDEDDDDDDDNDDDDDDDMEDEEEEEEEVQKPQKTPKKETPKQNGVVKKQEKTPKSAQKGQDKTPKGDKSPQGKDKTPAADKSPKKGEKTPKADKGQKTPGKEAGGASPQKRTIEGGVMIEDLKIGNGPVAKSGRIVQVYYEGRLKSNNKMFDSAKDGNGFKFRLGRQEVIKGWDVGVAGMKVGGKRRIICPPSMAYGAQGSPPVIPAHSTLVFEVELKQVK